MIPTSTAARLLAPAAALLLAAAPLAAQDEVDEWSWNGPLASGQTLILKNMNGAVRVERGGRELEIFAVKRARRGSPDHVRIQVDRLDRRDDGDLLVCALWGEDASCDEDGYHNPNNRRRWPGNSQPQVNVEFTVRVPEGVRLDLSTVNGELRIEGATSEVQARTVNGAIRASSLGGPVTARTVNGGITVRMADAGRDDLDYQTVNGSIVIELPERVDADVNMEVVNGRIDSDFPLTVRGRINPRRINATLGDGGRRLHAKTVNGSITLRSTR